LHVKSGRIRKIRCKHTKAAIYCRVSTDDQEREGTSLKTQLEACNEYCQAKDYQVFRQFKESYSGLTLDRPKLNELRELVRTSSIDIIVIYCLDRLSRDPTHGVIIFQELEKHGVILEAVTEIVDSTELGKLINYIRGFASKLEAEKIRERTMRGKLAHLKEGRLPQGTGIGIYGYRWDKQAGRRVINELESKVVKKIFDMAISGVSTNQIAISLNKANVKSKSGSLWHPLTVGRVLRNQTYTGKTYFGQTKRTGKTKVQVQPKENWILLPDVTPAIITDEVFNQAQAAIKKSKESHQVKPKSDYLLTGFIRCMKCGSTIGGTTLNGKYRYYKCRGSNPTPTREKICDAGYIRAGEVEEFVWKRVSRVVKSPGALLRALNDIEKSGSKKILKNLEVKIEKLKKSLKSYPLRIRERHELLGHEDINNDYVLDAINEFKRKRTKDELQLKQSQELFRKITQEQQLKIKFTDYCRNIRDSFSGNISLEKKRDVLRLFRTEVLAEPGHYTLATSFDAEIQSEHNKLLQSSLVDENSYENLVTIEQTSA
jgi:site-specific DNA recombinase